ncbi:DegT/DnrJ/EryC1/StrS family aminotransferase [Chloroflexota bacterium]
MIPIARPIMGKDEQNAVLEVLASGQLAQGPKVREFEASFAELCGVKHAIATTSGTSALHVALLAHGIGEGDEVITTSFSFIASANCALFVGARPVFADIEPEFYTIEPADISARITPKTKAILPVHLYGQPCDMDAISEIARKYDLVILEDACQAHGSSYKGLPVGSFGTACFSFYPTKNITTIEGGMITTNDSKIAERARLIRDHGSPRRYEHVMLGYNLRMNDLQAAIGLVQLEKLMEWNSQRQANAAYLTNELSKMKDVVPPKVREGSEHVFHQYTIRINDRDEAAQKLRDTGVGVGVHYPIPIHKQPLYQELGYDDSLPNSEIASQEVLSLPVHPSLSRADLDSIVEAVSTL